MRHYKSGHHYPDKTWDELSRSAKKKHFIGIKNKIREQKKYFRGLYTTSDILTPRTDWIDLYFLSKKYTGAFYNVTLETTFCRFSDQIGYKAWDNLFSPSSLSYYFKGPLSADQKQSLADEHTRLTEDPSMAVFERWEIDRSYLYGIGLHATIDEPGLTPEAIERFIKAFLDAGEVELLGTRPISFSAKSVNQKTLFPKPTMDSDFDSWASVLALRNQALDEQAELLKAQEGSSLIKPAVNTAKVRL